MLSWWDGKVLWYFSGPVSFTRLYFVVTFLVGVQTRAVTPTSSLSPHNKKRPFSQYKDNNFCKNRLDKLFFLDPHSLLKVFFVQCSIIPSYVRQRWIVQFVKWIVVLSFMV